MELDSSKRALTSEFTPNKKQKPLDELSEDGPLTQEDVVYFQKEAIWRQMKTYKQKCYTISRDMANFKRKYEENEAKLNVLDLWYEQIIRTFQGYPQTGSEKTNENLLIHISNASKEDVEDALEKRRLELLRVLSPVFESAKVELPSEKQALIQTIEELTQKELTLKADNETLSHVKNTIEESVRELREQILVLEKNSLRAESRTLERIDPNKDTIKSEENNNANPDVSTGETNVSGQAKQDSEDLKAQKTELEDLKILQKEIEAECNKLKEQVENLTSNSVKSEKALAESSARLNNLSDAELQNSSVFKQVTSQLKRTEERVEELFKANGIATQKLSEFEASKGAIKKLLDQHLVSENESLKQQLGKCESDLVRIRTARDELVSRLNIHKSETENKSVIEELQKAIDLLSKRIAKYEADSQKNFEESADDEKINSLSHQDLVKRVKLLGSEIKEVEEAFQSAREMTLKKLFHEVETESTLRKMAVEKTKADQKYFAAMRSKDALSLENKVLKNQVNKSQELVQKLTDLEKSYLHKIDILQKSESDLRSIKENSIQENLKLQDQLKSWLGRQESLQRDIKGLNGNLQQKIIKIEALEKENHEHEVKVSRLEAKLKETTSLVKKYRSNNTSAIIHEDDKQLEALRSIAKCSVCSKNWKDTAITVCGHVFCSECAQERLAARLRRCPSCNKGFSANDLLSIHL